MNQSHDSEALDLKIRHYLLGKNKLDQILLFQYQKIQYYERISAYLQHTHLTLQKSRKQRNQVKSTLMGNYGKLKQLEKEAICWKADSKKAESCQKNTAISTGKCKSSEHVKYILESGQREKQTRQIQMLKLQKKQIVDGISQRLQEDEPYIHQTILKKILRETKRAGKLQLIKGLEAVINENSKWLPSKKKQIDSEYMETRIQDSIKANLGKMKEIATHKVEVDDYIRDVCLEGEAPSMPTGSNECERTKRRVNNALQAIKMKMMSDEKQMEEYELEEKLKQQQQQKPGHASNVLRKQEIEELNSIIVKGIQLIRKPLRNEEKSVQEQNLHEKITVLNSMLMQHRVQHF